ncbi:MAG: ribosome small subunit-dependent GTPase A [Planctomycetota bacterium]
MNALKTGRVIRTDAKVCHVDVDGKVLLGAPRGILFDGAHKNPVAVGDRVEIDDSTSPASLERVLPRTNYLSRTASSHDPREQVLAANVDQLFVVGSVNSPGFSSNRTDRILAACVWQHIPGRVVLNKIDLATEQEIAALQDTYERVPFPVVRTCAVDGRGLDELRALIAGKTSVFYGASGAGKSSLLNALEPTLKLKTGKMSKYWETGKHTTSFSQLYRFGPETAIIDTPGIRVFRLHNVPTENLRDLFPDIVRVQSRCKFPTCTHDHEPDCAVFDAVESGALPASRYASYVELLDERRQGADDDDTSEAPSED